MKINTKLTKGTILKLDSYTVKQYENERVVDNVEVLEDSSGRAKWVLVYSPNLSANILAHKSDLEKPDIQLT